MDCKRKRRNKKKEGSKRGGGNERLASAFIDNEKLMDSTKDQNESVEIDERDIEYGEDAFERDLEFLLEGDCEAVILDQMVERLEMDYPVNSISHKVKKTKKTKALANSVRFEDIVEGIDLIDLSSDAEGSEPEMGELEAGVDFKVLREVPETGEPWIHRTDTGNVESRSDVNEKKSTRDIIKDKKKRKKTSGKHKEIVENSETTLELDSTSSVQPNGLLEDADRTKGKNKKSKRKTKNKNKAKYTEACIHSSSDISSRDESVKKSVLNSEENDVDPGTSCPEAISDVPLKKKVARSRKSKSLKRSLSRVPSHDSGSDSEINSKSDSGQEQETETTALTSAPRDSDSSKKDTYISSRKSRVPSLSAAQPVNTIFGLDSKQIFNLSDSDVKIKIISNTSNLSKFARNSIEFSKKHRYTFLKDVNNRRLFVEVCVKVALHEAHGFRKFNNNNADFCNSLANFDELTLNFTRTKLTKSKKDAHSNDIDYKVLSYFGHIFIWAYSELVRKENVVIDALNDIHVDLADVRSQIGGSHLWDRLYRDPKSMNSKRWKHVIELRSKFPFEINQFLLVLRYTCL